MMNDKEHADQISLKVDSKEKRIKYLIPVFDTQIDEMAGVASRLLAEHPESLTQFKEDLADRLFLASADNESNTSDTLRKYLATITKNINSPGVWKDMDNTPLSLEAAASLLLNLPILTERSELMKQTNQKLLIEVSESLAAALITKRYELSGNWRGAFKTLYSIFESTAKSQDVGTINKYFDLLLGDYKTVMPQDSISWRSITLSKAALAPEDEGILRKNSELDKSLSLMGEITGRREDRRRLAQSTAANVLQIDAARTVIYLGFDPRSGQGRDMYKYLLEAKKKDEHYKEKFGNLNIYKLSLKKLTPDQMEVAQLLAQNNDRHEALNQISESQTESQLILTAREVPTDPAILSQFPYSVVLYESEERRLLRSILDKAILKQQLYQMAEKYANQDNGEKWNIIPFAQSNLQGYAILNPNSYPRVWEMSAKEQAIYIKSLLEEYNLREFWEEAQKKQITGGNTAAMWREKTNKLMFILSKEGYVSKSQIETAMDLLVPDKIRRRSLELLGELVKKRFKIPRNFTKLPTTAGDSYDIENHPQMPGVFENVIVSKDDGGGIRFKIKLVNADHFINGTVGFPQDRLTIRFQGDASNLAEDLKWITESVVLSLLERSCCRPLGEEEKPKVLKEGEIAEESEEETSSGGFLVHVGGYRKSGARKEFTTYALNNFKTAMDEISRDTGGLSLVFVNEQHRAKVPNCERFLTWNKGWEKPNSKSTPRKAPDTIIMLQD